MANACYSNPAPTYQPAMRIIASLSIGFPVSVTTTIDHEYVTGMIVRLIIPRSHGMYQANQLNGTITVTGDTTFTMPINTTEFDPFVIPNTQNYTCAQCIPIGEDNDMLDAATRNVLPYSAS